MFSRAETESFSTYLSHHERLIARRDELLRAEREAASRREYLRAWRYSRRYRRAAERVDDFEAMMDYPW